MGKLSIDKLLENNELIKMDILLELDVCERAEYSRKYRKCI